MTKKPTKTGKELERRVADAYRQMGARKVEHDVELVGNQMDVYVELLTPGRLLHRIAIEVKDWSRTVGIDVVNKFAVVVSLLRSTRLIDEGLIVSASGFSKQARNAAKIHGIRLLELADLDAMIKGTKDHRDVSSTPPAILSGATPCAVHPQSEAPQGASITSPELNKNPSQVISLCQQNEHRYDVFISYKHADNEWVRNELLPRLEQAGLRVIIDYRDFEAGAPLITEMERAVLESRKTLLVLTPAYMESEWTEFESILVQTLNRGVHRRKILPIVLRRCEIPLRIRSLVYIDFSLQPLSEAKFQRLLEALARDISEHSSTAGGKEGLEPSEEPKRINAVTRHKDHDRVRNTGNLDVQILQAVYEYQQGHLGSPELSLSRLVETLGAERVHVVRCLRVLREKDWLDYNLTEGAESGLVWLTRFGTRVAESLHRD